MGADKYHDDGEVTDLIAKSANGLNEKHQVFVFIFEFIIY